MYVILPLCATTSLQLLFATVWHCLISSWSIKLKCIKLVVATTTVSWNAFQLPIAELLKRTCFCSYGMQTFWALQLRLASLMIMSQPCVYCWNACVVNLVIKFDMTVGVGTALKPQKWASSCLEAFPQVCLEHRHGLRCWTFLEVSAQIPKNAAKDAFWGDSARPSSM